jgi:hypothetical protein
MAKCYSLRRVFCCLASVTAACVAVFSTGGVRGYLHAATDSAAEISSLPASDGLRQAARSIGIVRIVSGNGFVGCPAAIISTDHVLQPDCEEELPGTSEKAFYMRSATRDIAYELKREPVERGNGWRIYKVIGRPSQHFGTISLSNAKVDHGWDRQVISVSYDRKDGLTKFALSACSVPDTRPETPYFAYHCEDQDKAPSSAVDFVFQGADDQLIGIGQRSGSTDEPALGLSINYIEQNSSIVRRLSPGPNFYDRFKMANDLTCEKAASLVADQEKLLTLHWWSYNEVAILLRACGEQAAINKTRTPDERILIVIRTISKYENQYTFEYVTRNDVDKIVYACMADPNRPRVELLGTIVKRGTREAHFDWSKRVGCDSVSNGLLSNEPFLITHTVLQPELEGMQKMLEEHGLHSYASKMASVWAPSPVPQNTPTTPPPAQADDGVKVGKVHEECLFPPWDDSFQVHSTRIHIEWGYQAAKTTMKKLRHCIKLTATGPIEVEDLAKEYVTECVNKALTDNAARHIVTALIGLGVDVLSAGASGGSGTALALADYVNAVKERALNCLTDERQIEETFTEKLKTKFDATVEKESHWIYWEL